MTTRRSLVVSLPARRRAEQLIDAFYEHRLAGLVPYLVRQSNEPSVAAALIVALVEIAAEARPHERPSADPEEHAAYLRAAHAAYFRGERHQWVMDGEREYCRLKKRRLAARRRATREAVA